MLARFRAWPARCTSKYALEEKTRASLRLVDEYMSLSVEQFFRKAVADMDALPRTGVYVELRKELMAEVIARGALPQGATSCAACISPTGDNEEYMHRIGFLKKFCMNILFLAVRREQRAPGLGGGAVRDRRRPGDGLRHRGGLLGAAALPAGVASTSSSSSSSAT